jgi:hypothetical protein
MKYCFLLFLIVGLGACKSSQQNSNLAKGDKAEPAYKIIYQINMPEKVQFVNQGKKQSVIRIEYNAVGTVGRRVWDLKLVNMDQGEFSRAISETENVEFPFWGKLTYNSDKGEGQLEFVINQKGYWVITLTTLTPN